MLASQFIQASIPTVDINDRTNFVLQLMDDYDVQHIAVTADEKYIGLISKEDALDADESHIIATVQQQLIPVSVKPESYFLQAVKIAAEKQVSLVPIVNEQNEIDGIILAKDLLSTLHQFIGGNEPGGIIVLEIEKHKYSFGELSRLVETNDAYITQLNTHSEQETGYLIVTIKLNKVELSSVIATFQRYEYQVRFYFGEEEYANELKENFNHLMSYLNI